MPNWLAVSLAEKMLQGAIESRDRNELNVAVGLWQQILAEPDPDPGPPDEVALYWMTLGVALMTRFELDGADADLAAAIEAYRAAMAIAPPKHPERPRILTNLGIALLHRFQHGQDLEDLLQAVDAQSRSVRDTNRRHPDWGTRALNLSVALRARFVRFQQERDLTDAITYAERAASAFQDRAPQRAVALSALAGARHVRFLHAGAAADLDAAIDAARSSVAALPAGHADRGGHLANLGLFLRERYGRTGASPDLEAAIVLLRQAVAAIPAGYQHRPRILCMLGLALHERSRLDDDGALLDEAIGYQRETVETTPPDHVERSGYLTALSSSLALRWSRTAAHDRLGASARDLDQAIELAGQAAEAAPPGTPARANAHSALGNYLYARAAQTEDAAALREAEAEIYRALTTLPHDHQAQAVQQYRAGEILREDFLRSERPEARHLAIKCYLGAAEAGSAPPTLRIDAARAAAELVSVSDPHLAARLLELAVLLLPEVAPRQLMRTDQQHQLGGFAGLAAAAASVALDDVQPGQGTSGRAARALALLEHGRGILLSQALDTRGDLSTLSRVRADLAERYVRLRDLLDQPVGAMPDVAALGTGQAGPAAPDRDEPDRHQLAGEFAATVAEIRGLRGFREFMLPPSQAELVKASTFGGTVVFNVSEYRSDALLVHPSLDDHMGYLPLPGLTPEALAANVERFHRAYLQRTALQDPALQDPAFQRTAAGDVTGQRDPDEVLLDVLEWLWDVVAEPVLDMLKYRRAPGPFGWWQVRWVPSGLLAQLPIHAAGYHRAAPPGQADSVIDRVISTYVPTLRALHSARGVVPPPDQSMRSLIVAMPTTPGSADLDLPGIAALPAMLPEPTLLMRPAKAEVLDRLEGSTIAHFACHGVTDPVDPSQSRLLLSDHRADPFTIAALAPLRLDSAGLAYLSACSTALNEVTALADESIHLATAFQLAGFPHVIGTLWEVEEMVADAVAGEFYTRLRTADGGYDLGKSAATLHHIVRKLRAQEPDRPFTWAPYLHAGA